MTPLRDRVGALRATLLPILQCAVAAALAWALATKVIGHAQPFFAPISAIIALGVSVGGRPRRAVEIVAGVAVGILVGDLLVGAIGTGTGAVALVVALAMAAAVLLGGSGLVVTQAASSAVLVATLQPPGGGVGGTRFVDALVGGAVGIAVHALVPAVDPLATVRRALAPLLAETEHVVADVARTLRRGDERDAQEALLRARGLTPMWDRFDEALRVATETTRSVPPRWGDRRALVDFRVAAPQLDLAVRGVRGLARDALRVVELAPHLPAEVPDALDRLADGLRAFAAAFDRGEGRDEAHAEIRRAAGLATLALERTSNMPVSAFVAGVRVVAVDLLRALGLDRPDALAAVRSAAEELEAAGAG